MSITAKDVYSGVPISTRGEVTHISADPTGATDAVAFPCGRVAVVRSTTDALECSVFAMHSNPVTAVRFAPDGQLVASGDECGTLRVWDRTTHKQTMEAQVIAGPVRDIAFAADMKHLVVSGESRGAYAKAVKIPSGGSAGVCTGHTKRVVAVDVSSTKPPKIASASEDMSIGLYKGPPVREIDIPSFQKQHSGFVNDARFSPDGSMVAFASSDRTLSIVDVASSEVVRTLEGHTGSVTGVAWSPDGATLFSSGNDKTNRVWRVADGECLSTITHGKDVADMQIGCAYVAKNKALVSASLGGELSVYEDGATAASRVLRGHSKQIVGLAVVGGKAYSADYSGVLVQWKLGSGSSDKAFSGKGPASSVCAVAANERFVANVGQDGKIFVTCADKLEFGKPVVIKGGGVAIAVPGGGSATAPAAVVVNETRLVALTPAGDAVASEVEFARGESGVSLAVTADGARVAVGMSVSGGAGELRFFSVGCGGAGLAADGKMEALRFQTPPSAVAFSDDGSRLAVGESSRRVRFYNATDGERLDGGGLAHTARVDAIAFEAGGARAASGAMDGSLAVWAVGSDADPAKAQGAHRGGVTGLGWAADGSVVSSGSDACLRSWTV